MTLIERAAIFARRAHKNQRRKYTGEPYFTHCAAVAELVMQRTNHQEVIAAAYLHDTLEDTDTSREDIARNFTGAVASLVVELTDVFTDEAFPYLNRATRKGLEVRRLATVSASAKMIKICDLEHNASDIVENAPGPFAVLYMKEKAALLEVLE